MGSLCLCLRLWSRQVGHDDRGGDRERLRYRGWRCVYGREFYWLRPRCGDWCCVLRDEAKEMLELCGAVFLRVALGVVVVGGVVDGLVGLAQPKVLLFCCFRKREGSLEIGEGK